MTLPSPHRQPALVVLAHLRWNFVFQRPQHLMTQAAADRAVYFIEEPFFGQHADHLDVQEVAPNIHVCVPHIEIGHPPAESQARTARVLRDFVQAQGLTTYDLWVYTPMEYPVAALLHPRLTVYDCMDELSLFRGAPPELRVREAALLDRADVVFTGGHRLFEAKREQHANAHPFPSSVDTAHFHAARTDLPDPAEQRALPHPRLGYAGVIDERLDIALLGELAARHPGWQFVMLGPVVKIDPRDLPQAPNLHYVGMQPYAALPAFMAHWDAGLLPFAHNDATTFISPTKTPEYLAAGLPVVSTGIRDVIRPYGERDLVRIADGADAFSAACADALAETGTPAGEDRRARADAHLSTLSWAQTWADMQRQLDAAAQARTGVQERA